MTLVVYPFRMKVAKSPLRIPADDGSIITFNFGKLPLFLQEAEYYVRQHITCMYPLLPTMRGTNRMMMKQVMDELAALYRHDEVSLAQQFVWMNLLLDRTTTIGLREKAAIRKELKVYDPLWNENPRIQQMLAQSKAEGKAEGALENAQTLLVSLVKARFPALTKLAKQKAAQINDPRVLNYLVEQIVVETDEAAARVYLRPTAA